MNWNIPSSAGVEAEKKFRNPQLADDEILLGNFEADEIEEGEEINQEEKDRTKFADIKYISKRMIPAYGNTGEKLEGMYAVAVKSEEYYKIPKE